MSNKIRYVLMIIYLIIITVICIVTNEVCHNDSSACTASWWKGRHTENELSWDHDRGCFNQSLRGETMFGDNTMTWSSLYFAAPIVFLRVKNFWLVLATVWIATTSFIFHATYSPTANSYDIIGIRAFSTVIVIELLCVSLITSAQSWIQTVKYVFLKGIVVLMVYYIGRLQWEHSSHTLLNNHVHLSYYYRDRSWTYAWVLVPLLFMLPHAYNDIFKTQNRHNTLKILSVLVFIGIGVGLLIGGHNGCGTLQWYEQSHFYGHLFVALGLIQICSLEIWETSTNDYNLL